MRVHFIPSQVAFLNHVGFFACYESYEFWSLMNNPMNYESDLVCVVVLPDCHYIWTDRVI